MKNLLIIGARGFGREVYRTFILTPEYTSRTITVKGFLDDNNRALDNLNGDWPPIIGSVESYEVKPNDVFFCALGDSHWRNYYSSLIANKGGCFINIIHPKALVSSIAQLGKGCMIGPFTTISPNVTIGNHVIIQSYCNIGHDAMIEDYATLESYVFLGGYASVGESATMHTKSSIIPHKSIGKGCVVGIDSVVIRNFKDGTHVFGNPAVKLDY